MHATVESVQLKARKTNVSGYDLGCSSRYGVVWFLMEIVKTCPIYKQLTKSLPSHAHPLMLKHSFWLHLLGHLPLGSLLGTSRMHTMSVLFLIASSSAQFSITMLRLALAHPNSWQKKIVESHVHKNDDLNHTVRQQSWKTTSIYHIYSCFICWYCCSMLFMWQFATKHPGFPQFWPCHYVL